MNLMPIFIPITNNLKKIDILNLKWNNPVEIFIIFILITCFILIIMCAIFLIKNIFDL